MNDLKKRLLEHYKQFYKEKPYKYKGACKVSRDLNLSKEEHGYNYWNVHSLLQDLQKDGYLEQKEGFGFRYIDSEKKSKKRIVKSKGFNRRSFEETQNKIFAIMEKAKNLQEECLLLSEEINDLYDDTLEISGIIYCTSHKKPNKKKT